MFPFDDVIIFTTLSKVSSAEMQNMHWYHSVISNNIVQLLDAKRRTYAWFGSIIVSDNGFEAYHPNGISMEL